MRTFHSCKLTRYCSQISSRKIYNLPQVENVERHYQGHVDRQRRRAIARIGRQGRAKRSASIQIISPHLVTRLDENLQDEKKSCYCSLALSSKIILKKYGVKFAQFSSRGYSSKILIRHSVPILNYNSSPENSRCFSNRSISISNLANALSDQYFSRLSLFVSIISPESSICLTHLLTLTLFLKETVSHYFDRE